MCTRAVVFPVIVFALLTPSISSATLAFDLRNPSSFNQDLSVRRDFHVARMRLGLMEF